MKIADLQIQFLLTQMTHLTLKLIKLFDRSKNIYYIKILKIIYPLVPKTTNNNVIFCFLSKDSFCDENVSI